VIWVDGRPRLPAGSEVPLAVNAARGTAAGRIFGTDVSGRRPPHAPVTLPAGWRHPAGSSRCP
jgi:hypothetical protein